jgi:hypothetical protein
MSERVLGVLEALRRARAHAHLAYGCLGSPAGPGEFRVPDQFRGQEMREGMSPTDVLCNISETGCKVMLSDILTLDQLMHILQYHSKLLDRIIELIEGSENAPQH